MTERESTDTNHKGVLTERESTDTNQKGMNDQEERVQVEDIDHGFLDKVEEYAHKYKTGKYTEMLSRGDKNKDIMASRVQYEATRLTDKVSGSNQQDKTERMDIVRQKQQPSTNQGTTSEHKKQTPCSQISVSTQVNVQTVKFEAEEAQQSASIHSRPRSIRKELHVMREEKKYLKVRDSWTETELEDKDAKELIKRNEVQTQTDFVPSKDVSETAHFLSPPIPEPDTSNLSSLPGPQESHQSPNQPPQNDITLHCPPPLTSPLPYSPSPFPTHSSSPLHPRLTPPHPCLTPPPQPQPCNSPPHPPSPPHSHNSPPHSHPSPRPPEPTSTYLPIPGEMTTVSHMAGDKSSGRIIHVFDIPRELAQRRLESLGSELDVTLTTQKPPNQEETGIPLSVSSSRIDVMESKPKGETSNFYENGKFKDESHPDTVFSYNDVERRQQGEDTLPLSHSKSYKIKTLQKFKDLTPSVEVEEDLTEYENKTMNELIDMFFSGGITFENLCKVGLSANDVSTRPTDEEEEREKKTDNCIDIKKLEQKASEAAAGLSESRRLMSKVSHLIQNSERLHTGRMSINRHVEGERSTGHSNDNSGLSRKSQEQIRWQQALSSYKKCGNSDVLLDFLELVSPECLTDEMIDKLIAVEEVANREVQNLGPFSRTYTSKSLSGTYVIESSGTRENETQHPDDINKQQSTSHSFTSRPREMETTDVPDRRPWTNTTTAKNKPREVLGHLEECLTELKAEMDSPKLPLDLTGLGSYSSASPLSNTLDTDTSSARGRLQQRRADIRKWMKNQRAKRKAQAKISPLNSLTQSQLDTYRNLALPKNSLKSTALSHPDIHHENLGLSGKQLRERSQEREKKKTETREDHMNKREKDALRLLISHKKESATFNNLMEMKGSVTSQMSRWQIKSNLTGNKDSLTTQQSMEPTSNLHKMKHVSPWVNMQKGLKLRQRTDPNLRGNSLIEPRTVSELSSVSSGAWEPPRKFTEKHKAEKQNKEITSHVQTELSSLMDCLASSRKRKHTPTSSMHRKYTALSNDICSSRRQESSSGSLHLPLNTTFTLPLDRIPEVASEISRTSVQTGESEESSQGAIKDTGESEDISIDSSWSMPSEVKKILCS